MKFATIEKKSEKDLHDLLQEKRALLGELRSKVAEGQLKDVREIRETRKTVAQVLTILNQKQAKSA
jgi:large subunit ribosomal protein L29